jgi:hypothetical protein
MLVIAMILLSSAGCAKKTRNPSTFETIMSRHEPYRNAHATESYSRLEERLREAERLINKPPEAKQLEVQQCWNKLETLARMSTEMRQWYLHTLPESESYLQQCIDRFGSPTEIKAASDALRKAEQEKKTKEEQEQIAKQTAAKPSKQRQAKVRTAESLPPVGGNPPPAEVVAYQTCLKSLTADQCAIAMRWHFEKQRNEELVHELSEIKNRLSSIEAELRRSSRDQ